MGFIIMSQTVDNLFATCPWLTTMGEMIETKEMKDARLNLEALTYLVTQTIEA